MADEEGAPARPLRAARLRSAPAQASARLTLPSGPTGRPTAAENDEAEEHIIAMRQLERLRHQRARVSTNIIALALAWRRDDPELRGHRLRALFHAMR